MRQWVQILRDRLLIIYLGGGCKHSVGKILDREIASSGHGHKSFHFDGVILVVELLLVTNEIRLI